MHGGVKFYRGAATAARAYVEADRSRADDYYLAEGTGIAEHLIGTRDSDGTTTLTSGGGLDGDAYELWVAGYDTDGTAKGRLRTDEQGLRFVEFVVNGPKTWSLAASVHPEIGAAYDAAQDRAAAEIITWLTEHSTTRIGPRGRQVQVPVERLDAAVVRHYTSRAGDPHRHLHVQVNARVFAQGRWRGLHSVGVVHSIAAINGIGHAAIACDPMFRQVLADHGYSLDPESGEITQLQDFAGEFSHRAAQIGRNLDRYEVQWRTEHPNEEPSPGVRRSWDRRAWADARPDKVTPVDGTDLAERWRSELHDLGFRPPTTPAQPAGVVAPTLGQLNRDAVVEVTLSRLGSRRSSWNAADLRGEIETLVAGVGVVAEPAARREAVEDLTARAVGACERLIDGDDVPEHIRCLTSARVLAAETELLNRITTRAENDKRFTRLGRVGAEVDGRPLDPAQQQVVSVLTGTATLVVIEGAAGAGKTTTLAAAAARLARRGSRMVLVSPTLKGARVAEGEVGAPASSAAWLAHHHGYRWDEDGRWTREPSSDRSHVAPGARLLPGDLLLVDEAGMLDQDTATALFTIADETGARIALMGDRHQLPAVGRGGVLDHAARWTPPRSQVTLDTVHRFRDPTYADLSLKMRTSEDAAGVFDQLVDHGAIVIHPSHGERTAALTQAGATGATVIAETREHVAVLNGSIRDHRQHTTATTDTQTDAETDEARTVTRAGEAIGIGDAVTTRLNNRTLDVANRDRWTVTGISPRGALEVTGRRGARTLPATYVHRHVELVYASTVHGAQGDTVDHAHFALEETSSAAATYVAMTRGRQTNTAHLVADNLDDARAQWVTAFERTQADLGPAHARRQAIDDLDRYGPTAPTRTRVRRPDTSPSTAQAPSRGSGIGF